MAVSSSGSRPGSPLPPGYPPSPGNRCGHHLGSHHLGSPSGRYLDSPGHSPLLIGSPLHPHCGIPSGSPLRSRSLLSSGSPLHSCYSTSPSRGSPVPPGSPLHPGYSLSPSKERLLSRSPLPPGSPLHPCYSQPGSPMPPGSPLHLHYSLPPGSPLHSGSPLPPGSPHPSGSPVPAGSPHHSSGNPVPTILFPCSPKCRPKKKSPTDWMQGVVQQMLHSEHGVPIKSHKRRLISAIPSAFTGADIVNWLIRNLSIQSKVEAIHLANLLCRHGYFFCIEGISGQQVKDDGALYRFQTPYYWPSQNPDISDFAYGVYLVKQVLRSKHRIRLLDYELKNLHKLKLRLAKEWKTITERAEDDVKVFREQKRVARAIMSSQEEAFWRLYRPPPGENSVQESALTRHGTELQAHPETEWTEEALQEELQFLKRSAKRTRWKVSTAVESIQNFCHKYQEFDPMLTTPMPNNPWVSNDDTLWTLESSLVESPSERQVRKWMCSFNDLLTDVTGRYNFEEYCKSQYNHENIRFWQACQDLKSLPLTAVPGSVQLVYDEFLQRGAASEVNISARAQEQVEQDLKTPTRYAFTVAQEEIYKLMQNDIYPRFLKSDHYQKMLRRGREVEEAGKGFFAKLQKRKVEIVKQDASGISPCLPQRYTKRQLSISRRLSTGAGSSSLDNIFLATNSSTAASPFAVETKRKSAYTEAFIDSLMAPDPKKILSHTTSTTGSAADTENDTRVRQRRVSAPNPPPTSAKSHDSNTSTPQLEDIREVGIPMAGFGGGVEGTIPMSYSADDLQQLMEDADSIGPSKWKKFGLAAGIEFSTPFGQAQEGMESLQVAPPHRCFSDNPHNMEEAAIRETLAASPRYGKAAYEFESINQQPGQFLTASSESVHSTHSH